MKVRALINTLHTLIQSYTRDETDALKVSRCTVTASCKCLEELHNFIFTKGKCLFPTGHSAVNRAHFVSWVCFCFPACKSGQKWWKKRSFWADNGPWDEFQSTSGAFPFSLNLSPVWSCASSVLYCKCLPPVYCSYICSHCNTDEKRRKFVLLCSLHWPSSQGWNCTIFQPRF